MTCFRWSGWGISINIKAVSVFILFCLALYAPKSLAVDAELSKQKVAILKAVINAEGYVDRDLHQEFWRGFPEISDGDKVLMDTVLMASVSLQYEVWSSVIVSMEAGEVRKSEALMRRVEELKSYYAASEQHLIEPSLRNIDSLLRAATTGRPFNANGEKLYVTKELANQVLSNLDASYERANILFDRQWRLDYKERVIGSELTVLWPFPFNVKLESVILGERLVNFYTFSSNTEDGAGIVISYLESSVNNTRKCVAGIAGRLGVRAPHILEKKFQGLFASEAVVSFKDSDSDYHARIKCVDTGEHLYSFMFISSEEVSLVEDYNSFMAVRVKFNSFGYAE